MAAGYGSEPSYDEYVQGLRVQEYPMLREALYLDHAGTTLYSKTQIDRFHADLTSKLLGNPHSMSPSSQRSTQEIDAVRIQALEFLGADPELFDLVFTSNTTAAIKLVLEALAGQESGFWYGYHVDSHTSLVGVRESSNTHRCFESDGDVERWLSGERCEAVDTRPGLFAMPAQSNLNGRRLPLDWIARVQSTGFSHRVYTLLDAAAFASTAPLCLDKIAPDFTVLSFSKIFGFPDLGGLVIKKDAADLFRSRKYFGGGTVDMVLCGRENWHARKTGPIHDQLEDGTLPIHSILALKSALATYNGLFGSLEKVASHTSFLAKRLYDSLAAFRHGNARAACTIYRHAKSTYGDASTQGPIIAFNMQDQHGGWVSNTEVEKLASINDIHLRTGGVCNPGGISSYLGLAAWEMHGNFAAGQRCGSEHDIQNGKPTGVIRVSFGAMSTTHDVDRFAAFIDEFFVDKTTHTPAPPSVPVAPDPCASLYVESLTVYPIKSCSGWSVPDHLAWDVRAEGLAWDREWCVVAAGSGAALSQKAYPRMALIRPELDFAAGMLRVRMAGAAAAAIAVPLSHDPGPLVKPAAAQVCGDAIAARVYTAEPIARFFTDALGVACTLARFPASSSSSSSSSSSAIAEAEGRRTSRHSKTHTPGAGAAAPIRLSNESPILTITRASVNRLNENLKAAGARARAVHPAVFRANILLGADPQLVPPGREQPWAEDRWAGMQIGGGLGPRFAFLGGCRRCQMVCVDPDTGERRAEPFVTLAKTRKKLDGHGGKVVFGVHTALLAAEGDHDGDGGGGARTGGRSRRIQVGDAVVASSCSDGLAARG